VPPARSVHALCRCNASRTELKHLASHSSTNMLTEAPNGLPAGEVSWFGRHALNMPPASQPQVPHAAAAPHPLERHPPPPHCNLHMTSRRGWRPQSLDVARRLAGDIHDDAPSWGGRPSPPRARPGTAVGRIVASSSKRGHAPATGDHFAGPKNWLPTLGPVPNGASRTPLRGATMAGPASSWHPHAPCHTYCTGPAANQPVGHGVTVMQRVPQQAWLVRHTTRHDTVSRHIEPV